LNRKAKAASAGEAISKNSATLKVMRRSLAIPLIMEIDTPLHEE
jgi:hypothetical protein